MLKKFCLRKQNNCLCGASFGASFLPVFPAGRRISPRRAGLANRNPRQKAGTDKEAPDRSAHEPTSSSTALAAEKNCLHLSRKWCRIVAPRQIKGRAQDATNTPRPYAGAVPPTLQYITVPTPIIAEICRFIKRGFVSVYMRCGVLYPAPLSVCLDGNARRGPGREVPPPGQVPLRQGTPIQKRRRKRT